MSKPLLIKTSLSFIASVILLIAWQRFNQLATFSFDLRQARTPLAEISILCEEKVLERIDEFAGIEDTFARSIRPACPGPIRIQVKDILERSGEFTVIQNPGELKQHQRHWIRILEGPKLKITLI